MNVGIECNIGQTIYYNLSVSAVFFFFRLRKVRFSRLPPLPLLLFSIHRLAFSIGIINLAYLNDTVDGVVFVVAALNKKTFRVNEVERGVLLPTEKMSFFFLHSLPIVLWFFFFCSFRMIEN